jgi:hypothetical protein
MIDKDVYSQNWILVFELILLKGIVLKKLNSGQKVNYRNIL